MVEQAHDTSLSFLRDMHKVGDGAWVGNCPVCGDGNHTLNVRIAGENSHLHCENRCDKDEIVRSLGISWQDLYPKNTEYHTAIAKYGRSEVDPYEVERMVLLVYSEYKKLGKPLTPYDEARAIVASDRVFGK